MPTAVRQDIAEFFRSCTADNVRWRQNVKRKLEMAAASAEFIQLSKLALSYAHGLPGKFQQETDKRESLVFVTTTGLLPWDERMDNMKPQTDKMIAEKATEEKLKAIEVKAEPAAADKEGGDTEIPETLELVTEPPQDFNPGRGGR